MCAGLLLTVALSLPAKAQPEEKQTEADQSLPDARSAKSGWYLDLNLLSTIGNLAVGYDYDGVRLEGGFYGVLVETANIYGQNYAAFISSLMVNAYSDLVSSPEARWSPYIGIGLGYGNLGITDGNVTLTSSGGFTYRFSGGLSYAFNESWDGNILIGYQGLSVAEIGEVGQFGGGLGLRYRF